jgi:hypothetical protein
LIFYSLSHEDWKNFGSALPIFQSFSNDFGVHSRSWPILALPLRCRTGDEAHGMNWEGDHHASAAD